MKFLRIIIFIPLLCQGQETLRPSLGFSVGCNISRHYLPTPEPFPPVALDRAAGLNLGLIGLIPVQDVFCIKSSASFSWMYSSWGFPYFKLRNQYAEFSLCAATRFRDELIFSVGINHAELLNSDFLRMDEESNWQAYPTDLFHSQQSVDAGLELKLQKNFSLLFDYFIPLKPYGTKNFRVGMNIRLTGRTKRIRDNWRKAARERAVAQITELKNGTLLVRLHEREDMLKEIIRNDSLKFSPTENEKIVSAFKKSFHFCPVMFFRARDSEKILQKNFRGLFLNDDLLPDSSLIPDTTNKFFIAEFTELEPDTQKYFSGYYLGTDTAGNRKMIKRYYGAPNFGFYALLMRDEKFIPLRKPFPYYAEAIQQSSYRNISPYFVLPPVYFLWLHWTYSDTIEKMDTMLSSFYELNYSK